MDSPTAPTGRAANSLPRRTGPRGLPAASTPAALEGANLDARRDPAAVEVAGLRLHLLVVDKARFDPLRVQRHMVGKQLIARCRLRVVPAGVFGSSVARLDSSVTYDAEPLNSPNEVCGESVSTPGAKSASGR